MQLRTTKRSLQQARSSNISLLGSNCGRHSSSIAVHMPCHGNSCCLFRRVCALVVNFVVDNHFKKSCCKFRIAPCQMNFYPGALKQKTIQACSKLSLPRRTKKTIPDGRVRGKWIIGVLERRLQCSVQMASQLQSSFSHVCARVRKHMQSFCSRGRSLYTRMLCDSWTLTWRNLV